MNIVTDILEILIGFFLMASLMATPTCIFVYFIISLVKYLKQKKKLDADCLKNHSKMKRANSCEFALFLYSFYPFNGYLPLFCYFLGLVPRGSP